MNAIITYMSFLMKSLFFLFGFSLLYIILPCQHFYIYLFFFFWYRVSRSPGCFPTGKVSKDDFELLILLIFFPECFYSVLRMELRALCLPANILLIELHTQFLTFLLLFYIHRKPILSVVTYRCIDFQESHLLIADRSVFFLSSFSFPLSQGPM